MPFRGPSPALYAVVGEAPGRTEDQRGVPFVGPAGRLLEEYLHKGGLNLRDAFICNTVSCFPHGTPRQEHIDACQENLADQLKLSLSPYILILGAVALSAFKPGASIMAEHGKYWTVEREGLAVTLFPTLHPAAILRNGALKRAWRLDLECFGAMVRQGDHKLPGVRYVVRTP